MSSCMPQSSMIIGLVVVNLLQKLSLLVVIAI